MSTSLHTQVLDALGRKIVSGQFPPGTVVRAENLVDDFSVSRGVIREVIRSLQLLGMTESVKSLGVRVRPKSQWNPYAREIIRWRLYEGDLGAQLRSITELRSVVEPAAAELSARHAPVEIGERLMELASQMRTLGRSGDLDLFEKLDIEFHALILAGSGNEMFAHLDVPIGEILRGRVDAGLMPAHPHEDAMQWHVDVADAVQGRRPEEARAAMTKIVVQTVSEISSIWDGAERQAPQLDAVQSRLAGL